MLSKPEFGSAFQITMMLSKPEFGSAFQITMMLSKPEFGSVSHVGVPFRNNAVSPLSLWERVRVRGF
jgi:ABC-type sulfate transport system permease component